jgi:hypothetical protein
MRRKEKATAGETVALFLSFCIVSGFSFELVSKWCKISFLVLLRYLKIAQPSRFSIKP